MPSDLEDDYISWIQQFCEVFGHDYFVQVSQDFIEDDFNLTGLSLQVPFYREALYTILDYQVETAEDHANTNNNNSISTNNNNNNNNNSNKFTLKRDTMKQLSTSFLLHLLLIKLNSCSISGCI